jgi:amino acid transporter
MLIAMYNYLGYYDICFVAGEVRRPERVIPRAVLWSVLAIALVYCLLTLAMIGVVPWREAAQSRFLAATFMESVYGSWAGRAVTVLILWSALGSVLTMLLGYSRVPYAAALDGYFFKPFTRLHASGNFPHVSLVVVGGLAMAASLLELEWVLTALLTARILVQFVVQVLAVFHIRRARPDIALPFRMWLYPIPAVVALVGWLCVFFASGKVFLVYAALLLASGVGVFAVWRRTNRA